MQLNTEWPHWEFVKYKCICIYCIKNVNYLHVCVICYMLTLSSYSEASYALKQAAHVRASSSDLQHYGTHLLLDMNIKIVCSWKSCSSTCPRNWQVRSSPQSNPTCSALASVASVYIRENRFHRLKEFCKRARCSPYHSYQKHLLVVVARQRYGLNLGEKTGTTSGFDILPNLCHSLAAYLDHIPANENLLTG